MDTTRKPPGSDIVMKVDGTPRGSPSDVWWVNPFYLKWTLTVGLGYIGKVEMTYAGTTPDLATAAGRSYPAFSLVGTPSQEIPA